MNYGLLVIVVVVLGGLLLMSRRSKQRIAARETAQRRAITLGTEVMTTSGLYGTVVGIDEDDDTVRLAIARGVEVKWAMAALRDASSLPERYRGPIDKHPDDDPTEPPEHDS